MYSSDITAEKKKTLGAGMGLGLYVSAQIVRQHNGERGLESDIGKGARFWFTLPIDV